MPNVISNRAWIGLFTVLFVAYLLGLFVPLMNEDASHHANIALRMVQTHNYLNLIDDNGQPYLDKPHLHFWLSALSFNLFGVNTVAYKIPALLATLLGLFATFKLGILLYNRNTGLLAAAIYASAQAQFLANNDVRMDALLTGSIVFATWQLVAIVYQNRWFNYLLAPLGLAMAFTTKGMIGLVMPVAALFCLLAYQRNWKAIFNLRWFIVAFLWLVYISPCLYAYYQQYDLHPETVVRGMKNVSGVKFILWQQNFERFEGKSWGKGHKDYFFFFHTALWAFLPFCLLMYAAFYNNVALFIKTRFKRTAGYELLPAGTIIIIFAIISSAGYQLPHYLNILFPFFALLTAQVLVTAHQTNQQGQLKIYLGIQYFVIGAVGITLVLLNFWCFFIQSWLVVLLAAMALAAMLFVAFTPRAVFNKIVLLSVLMAGLTNILLNGNVYQQLLNYQAGIGLAQTANRTNIPKSQIFNYECHSSAFNFYAQHITPYISASRIKVRLDRGEEVWIYTTPELKNDLQRKGFKFEKAYVDIDYGITRLTPKFLNPATRRQVCTQNYLIKIKS